MANLNGEFGGNPGLFEAFDLFNGRFVQTLKLTRRLGKAATRTRDFDRWKNRKGWRLKMFFSLVPSSFLGVFDGFKPNSNRHATNRPSVFNLAAQKSRFLTLQDKDPHYRVSSSWAIYYIDLPFFWAWLILDQLIIKTAGFWLIWPKKSITNRSISLKKTEISLTIHHHLGSKIPRCQGQTVGIQYPSCDTPW